MKKVLGGFSLIDMICVLTILAIIFSVAVPSFIGYSERYYERICKNTASDIIDDIKVNCVSERIRFTEDNLSVTEIIVKTVNEYADGDLITLFSDYNANYEIRINSVCPHGGTLLLSWTIVHNDINDPEYSDVSTVIRCSEHGNVIYRSFRVIYK